MALQFDPRTYLEILSQRRLAEQNNHNQLGELLGTIGQTGQTFINLRNQKNAQDLAREENKTLGERYPELFSQNKISQPVSSERDLQIQPVSESVPVNPLISTGTYMTGGPQSWPQEVSAGMADYATPQRLQEAAGSIDYKTMPQKVNHVENFQKFISGQQQPEQPQQTEQPSLMTGIDKLLSSGKYRMKDLPGLASSRESLFRSQPKPQSQEKDTDVYSVDQKKGTLEKIGTAPKGSHFVSVPTGGDEKSQRDLDNRFTKLGAALDPSNQSRGSFGVSKQVFDRAERLESLASALPDGNLDRRQIEELAIGLNSMLSGSNTGAQQQVEALVPKTVWGDVQKLTEFLSNNPTGTQQQSFVNRMLSSIAREKQTASKQMNRTRFSRIASYADLEKKNPEMFNEVLQSNGVDPEEYRSWKKGGFKQMSAVSEPGENQNKPQTIQRRGKDGNVYTYTLNTETGKYE